MPYTLTQLKEDLVNDDVELYMNNVHWGKSGWNFLYNAALGNKSSKLEIQNFLLHLGPILPCEVCKEHYQDYISRTALPKDNLSMFVWLEKLENEISHKKYGRSYRPANRINQVNRNVMEVIEKVTITSSGEQMVEKKRNCKRCGDKETNDLEQTMNQMSNRGRIAGLSLGLNNSGFLRQNGYFGNKI